MSFQISPIVNVTEYDATAGVPAVSTTEAGIAGVFLWGPVGTPVLVDSEEFLKYRFGKPSNHNGETWLTAASFLAYSNQLYVTRAANTDADANLTIVQNSSNVTFNAIANTVDSSNVTASNLEASIIRNNDHYDSKDYTLDETAYYIAKYPGALGNSLRVSVCDSPTAYTKNRPLVPNTQIANTSNIAFTVGSNTALVAVSNTASGTLTAEANAVLTNLIADLSVGDYVEAGNTLIGKQYLRVSSVGAIVTNSTHYTVTLSFNDRFQLSSNWSADSVTRYWEFFENVDRAPGTSAHVAAFGNTSASDELHVVVVDEDGLFTSVPGTILEVFRGLSRATDAKTDNGGVNYYRDVLNQSSEYIWWANDRSGAISNTSLNVATAGTTVPLSVSFILGSDGQAEDAVPISVLATAYDEFADAESIDVSFILAGKARGGTYGEQLANYLIDNIGENRKDCVVVISPDRADVVNNTNDELDDVLAFRNAVHSTSYGIMDSGYKYMYDRYNDVYRHVPLNGDIAGLMARTDRLLDSWWSPAGFNRGQIKNVVKLSYNVHKLAHRNQLYKADVNSVVTFPGQGPLLFGDKTLLAKPGSAFSHINVRRLFITLEKAISTAAKYMLFEFNDDFTQARFRNSVEPFLRDVQGRRGITRFQVVCDNTNNTDEVKARNEFVGSIFVVPAYSINFIQLNFVAVRGSVEFSEVVGSFA